MGRYSPGGAAGAATLQDVTDDGNTTTNTLLGADGTVSAPGYSFSADTNTGIYRAGNDNFGIASGGQAAATISYINSVWLCNFRGPSGSAATPTYSFSADTDTGIYRSGADKIGFGTAGTERATIDSTGIAVVGVVSISDGTAALPAYSFSGDPDTGMYRKAANSIGWATGGSERMSLDSGGSLGTFNNITITKDSSPSIRITSASSAIFEGRQSNGTTSSPTATTSAQSMTIIDSYGYGTGILRSGRISFKSTETFTASAGGTKMIVQVTPNGASTPIESLVLDQNGDLQALGVLRSGDGSAALPAYSFTSDPDTGIYSAGANSLGFAVNGAVAMTLSAGTLSITASVVRAVSDGSAATPLYGFNNDPDTGVYRPGDNRVGISCNGVLAGDFTTTGLDVVGAVTATTSIDATTIVSSGDGTNSAPTHSFSSDTNTGMYRAGANSLGLTAGGTQRLLLNSSGATVTGALTATTGIVNVQSVVDFSSPPTDAELDSAFGTPATVGRGFIATIDDADGDTAGWTVWASDASWYYIAGTKAV